MSGTIIFHVDVNSAFLSWEAVRCLKYSDSKIDLREIPSAVGGDMSKRRGVILAKSIPAKKYQVKTGEPITDARKKCPDLVLVPPDHQLYEKSSQDFLTILREYSPDVEKYSIDEVFVDMTGTTLLYGSPVEAATRIKDRISRELGFTVNIGISSNKFLAKMASDFEKPNRVHTLFPEEIREKMWPLPVSDLLFAGKVTTKKLYALGIKTIGDLANADLDMLKAHLKKHGEVIWNFANGIDMSVVEAEPSASKGCGNSTTIAFDVTDEETAKMVLLSLAESVGARLRESHMKAEMVSVGIKDYEFRRISHQCMLPEATNHTSTLYQTACRLFDECWDGTPIRNLGLHTGKLVGADEEYQMNLFTRRDDAKMEKLDEAVDKIRKKYGAEAVKRASFLKNN